MKWTEAQFNSIYAKPAQICVSAAAGSGKTQVLTARITERVKDENPVSIDRLLVVTFTKAAAAEMKERISKSLKEALNDTDDKEKISFLKRQISLLPAAQICTIDSFCYDVVRRNFYRADLPFDIRIGEKSETDVFMQEALEEVIDSFYSAMEMAKGGTLNEEGLAKAALVTEFFPKEELELILSGFDMFTQACSSDKKDSDFTSEVLGGDYTTMISLLYDKASSEAFPDKWLDKICSDYNPSEVKYQETPFCIYSYNEALRIIKESVKSLRKLAEISESFDIGYEAALTKDAQILESLLDAPSYDSLYSAFLSADLFPKLSPKKRNCDADTATALRAHRDFIKKNVTKTAAELLQFDSESSNNLLPKLYPQIKALVSCVKLLNKLYYEKITAKKMLDFNSCAHAALNILTVDGISPSEAGLELLSNYDEIYIDEFQDSNGLQDTLFSIISNGNLFMVGDVKQSIYGFRNSDPSIFMKKCDESDFDENASKRKIFLSKNFRSRESIINGVNSIFDVLMTKGVGGVDYKGEHRLEFGADFIPEKENESPCEICVLESDENIIDKATNEALLCADKINSLINSDFKVWDKDSGKMRKAEFRDFAILMRTKKSAQTFRKILSEKSIPSYFDSGSGLFTTNEAIQIIEILKLIDNSENDIPLACALRSPMFLFDENELLEIKASSKESFHNSFYGICSGKYKVNEALYDKCCRFMNILDSWRSVAEFVGVEELIRRIYADTDIYSIALSFPDGELRRANLDLLLDKANQFEQSSFRGLFNFVNYIEKIRSSKESQREAQLVSDKMNVCHIMSIHKSKGLEFPVVFLVDCSHPFKKTFSKAHGLVMDSDLGIGMNIIDPVLRTKFKSPMCTAVSRKIKCDNVAEELRLLYVALTRARERLFVLLSVDDINKYESSKNAVLPFVSESLVLAANSYASLFALSMGHGADKAWAESYVDAYTYNNELSSSEDFSGFVSDKEVKRLLCYEYPHKEAVNLPNKASVTYLKSFDINLIPENDGSIHTINAPSSLPVTLRKPQFDKKKNGLFFGTVHHKVLQHLDFSAGDAKAQCQKLFDSKIITEDEYKVIDFERIEIFLNSQLCLKMKESKKIYREEAFIMALDASEADSSLSCDEKIYVQGIIDCFFEDADGNIILIDYKTDYYNDPSEIINKYRKQLYFYDMALKLKFNNKVIKKYLYLLHNNDIIKVE